MDSYMDVPTREHPAISLKGVRLMRGYELVRQDTGRVEFLGCHDGPLVELNVCTGQKLRLSVDFVPQLIEALQAVIVPPVAAPGAHDDEIVQMGYRAP